MQRTLTIIIPAYNEEKKLEASVEEAMKAANQTKLLFEIIIIDDASSDSTWDCAESIKNKYSNIKTIKNKINKGLGGSYKVGLAESNSEFITWVPADCSHDHKSLLEAYHCIGDADMIIPLPKNPEVRGLKRRVISQLFTLIINTTNRLHVPYYNGLTIHRVSLLRKINIETNSFAFQAEAIVKLIKKGASYKIVSTFISDRNEGRSKAFTWKNIASVILAILSIYKTKNM